MIHFRPQIELYSMNLISFKANEPRENAFESEILVRINNLLNIFLVVGGMYISAPKF